MARRRQADTMTGRGEMSRLLIKLRGDRLQSEAAQLAGLTQTKISRAERGRFPLSPTEADAYAAALGASHADRRRLVELADIMAAEHIVTRAALVRSDVAIQERVGRLEADASLIRSWQPEIVPGILQTEDYTAAVVGIGPGPEWLAQRATRRAKLREPERTWHQLVSEATIRWPLAPRQVMVDQINYLIEVSHLDNLRLGILDFARPKPMAPPAAFHLYDTTTTMVATEVGTSFVTNPRDIQHFEGLFTELHAAALYGNDVRTLLERIAKDHRRTR